MILKQISDVPTPSSTRTAIEVLVATIVALVVSTVVLGFKYRQFGDGCMSHDSSLGLFGRVVIAASPIPSLFVVGKSKTQIVMKAILGVLVFAIVALFWFWMLRNPDGCS